MPYKFEYNKIKLPPNKDARRKLTEAEKERIRRLYSSGSYSQRELAGKFNVSRRLIVFTIYPERLKKLQQHKKDIKYHLKAYNKDKHREYIKKYRHRKQSILHRHEGHRDTKDNGGKLNNPTTKS